MAGWRQAIEVAIARRIWRLACDCAIANRTASWVERARMLLAYRDDPSFLRWDGPWERTIRRQRCVERALAYGR